MALPIYAAVLIGGALVGYIAKDKTSPENVTNNNYPAQPDADSITYNSGDTVQDKGGLMILGALAAYSIYQWSK